MKGKCKYEVLVLIGMFIIAVLYIVSILKGQADPYFPPDYRIKRYLINIVKMGIAAILLAKAYQKGIVEKKRSGILFLVLALLAGLVGHYWSLWNIRNYLHMFLLVLWSFISLGIATAVKKKENAYSIVGYYCIVTAGIWIIEEVLVSSELFRRDILEIIYLLGVALIAWNIEKQEWKSIITVRQLILPGISMGVLLINHERFMDIIYSLGNPIHSVSGVPAEVNWLGHRITMMRYAGLDLHQVMVLLVEAAVLYCLYKMYCQEKTRESQNLWMKIQFCSIFLWTCIGFLAEIFLISSTGIRLLLLGDTQLFIMIVLWLQMVGTNEWKEKLPDITLPKIRIMIEKEVHNESEKTQIRGEKEPTLLR